MRPAWISLLALLVYPAIYFLSAAEEPAGEEMLRSLLEKTARHHRERMWRGLAAAAAVILIAVGAGAGGWDALHSGSGGSAQHEVEINSCRFT